MQLSMLIGKQILTPAGERLGYVTGAYLDRELKKLSAIVAADADEEEFYMPARAILAYNDAVIAKNTRIRTPGGVPSPVGLPAYSEQGELLGSVSDWLFGEEDAVLLFVKDGVRTSVPVQNVLMGETVIVYSEPPKKRPVMTSRPPQKKRATAEPAPAVQPPEAETFAPAPFAPQPVHASEHSFNRCNLLGRRVKKSVFDECGQPVVLAGERITPEILSRARRSNRLLTLTVNTLTNIW